MKIQSLSLSGSKEYALSKFGIDFLVKNDKVYLLSKHGPLEHLALIENDVNFFKMLIKNWEKSEFSSSFEPCPITESDWKLINKKLQSITLQVTNRCNSDCKICWAKDSLPYKDMSINEIKEILSKLGKNKNIILLGGEPTVRNDIFKIIRLIKKSGNFPILYTNGLKLADSHYVERLKKSGIKRVMFSIDSFREYVNEELRGNSKQLIIKLKALKNLEVFDIKVKLSSVIAAGINDDEIENILRFCIKNNHFIQGINFFGATPYMGKFDINIKKYLTPSDILNLLEKASNGVISKEYLLEFQRFRINIHNIFNEFGIYFYVGNIFSPTLFRIEGNEIKHFIPLEELKEINERIEERKIISLMKYLFTKRGFMFLKLLLKKQKVETLGTNVFGIHVSNIITPLNYIPSKIDNNVIIAKIPDEWVIMHQGSG